MVRLKRDLPRLLALVFLGFGILFPFAALFSHTDSTFLTWMFDSSTLAMVKLTLSYSLLALLLGTLISLPLAVFIFNSKNHFTKVLQLFFEVLWVIPSFIFVFLTLSLLKVFKVEELYSLHSVLLAWVLISIPFLTVSFITGLHDLDRRERDAIRSLGANSVQTFFHFDLPKIKPAIESALLHQFWLYLTNFTIVLLLSGGPPNETLEVGIFTSVRMDRVDLNRACALAVWQLIFVTVIRFLLISGKQRKKEMTSIGVEWFQSGTFGILRKCVLGFLLMFFAFELLQSSSELSSALFLGVLLSGIVSIMTLLYALGLFAIRFSALAEVGAWLSPMVLSLAWWKAYRFTFSPLFLCILIQVLLLSPWVARMLYPKLRRSRVQELNAVATLGASPFQAWIKVEWPRVRGDVFWMLGLIFALSLAEVSMVILFSNSDFEPLAVWIQNQFSRFQLNDAFQGTLVLILISALCMVGLTQDRRESTK